MASSMMTDKNDNDITVSEEELFDLDSDVAKQFVKKIETAVNEVFEANDMNDFTPELLVALLSCAAQISLELDVEENDLAYIMFQAYSNVKDALDEQKKEELLKNWDIN